MNDDFRRAPPGCLPLGIGPPARPAPPARAEPLGAVPFLLYPGAAGPRYCEAYAAAFPGAPFPGALGACDYPFEPAFIQKRNERERQRVRCVNEGYARLRGHLPGGLAEKRLSKVETLRAAIRYIKHLQELLSAAPDGPGPREPRAPDSSAPPCCSASPFFQAEEGPRERRQRRAGGGEGARPIRAGSPGLGLRLAQSRAGAGASPGPAVGPGRGGPAASSEAGRSPGGEPAGGSRSAQEAAACARAGGLGAALWLPQRKSYPTPTSQ
ncbi:achaete-scute homolog 5 [Hippopotamus amphibius kiboko]|uniref:achaete-scute homolog 5 n=1 Tax=Hippopotamus amphibius kiboko TaxID=575201 RepID=UPI00259A3280|nr:achaete-scute homolog 5 [Hippopotamus amphibius kiboko]